LTAVLIFLVASELFVWSGSGLPPLWLDLCDSIQRIAKEDTFSCLLPAGQRFWLRGRALPKPAARRPSLSIGHGRRLGAMFASKYVPPVMLAIIELQLRFPENPVTRWSSGRSDFLNSFW